MPSRKGSGALEKRPIPNGLYMAIIRLQAAENLSWNDACVRLSLLSDTNNEKFKTAINRRAETIYKSRFLSELNKARATIGNEYRIKTEHKVRTLESNFSVPCSKCGQLMYFSLRHADWGQKQKILYQAFGDWRHTSCL